MKTEYLDKNCICAVYENGKDSSEYYILVKSDRNRHFSDSLRSVGSHIQKAYQMYNLSKDTHVFSRFFFSDIANQKDRLIHSDIFKKLKNSACSFMQQPPLTGNDLTLLLYHIKGKSGLKKRMQNSGNIENTMTVSGDDYSLHFSCNLHTKKYLDPYNQTKHIFSSYSDFLTQHAMSLINNTVRTWLYINDIDNHYKEIINARKEVFDTNGLTKETHYIASTGIGAGLADAGILISLDVISIENIKQEQITYLQAPQHLSPTHEYGVTFERGTKIVFGDRQHFHISGTASINKHGEVVHSDDIGKQTIRVIDNINALLSPHKVSINDMAYLIVYLRNMNHYGFAEKILKEKIDKNVLMIFVNASVCRPSLLVEIEGMGIIPCSADYPPFF